MSELLELLAFVCIMFFLYSLFKGVSNIKKFWPYLSTVPEGIFLKLLWKEIYPTHLIAFGVVFAVYSPFANNPTRFFLFMSIFLAICAVGDTLKTMAKAYSWEEKSPHQTGHQNPDMVWEQSSGSSADTLDLGRREQAEFAAAFDFEADSSAAGAPEHDRPQDQRKNFGDDDQRHPADIKLWAVVDDPGAAEQERITAFRIILKKQQKRLNEVA